MPMGKLVEKSRIIRDYRLCWRFLLLIFDESLSEQIEKIYITAL